MKLVGKMPAQLGSTILIVVALVGLYLLAPTWDPISKATPAQASFWTECLTWIGSLYLLVQAGQYIFGRVGNAGWFILDLGSSVIPLIVIAMIYVAHYTGWSVMSGWVQTIMRTSANFVLLDLVVLGGLGALVNRLTDEMAKQE